MTEEPEVDRLANSLKKSGVAFSWIDAVSKAKAILGFSNKKEEAPKVKVAEPTPEQQAKVDEIIKEVDVEIGKKEVIEPEKPAVLTNDVSKFDDPNFNIAESDMKVSDIVEAEEIFTNDPETLDKEKEGEKIEHEDDAQEADVVMTNEEAGEEKPVEINAPEDNNEPDIIEEKEGEKMPNGDDYEGDSDDVDAEEDSTYTEEQEITKEKTLFDF